MTQRGALSRLKHDRRGNALVIIAVAIIPVIAIVGGGLDISRTYIAKQRMQQACDASVLAARRSMTGAAFTSENAEIGRRLFIANFPDGKLGTSPMQLRFTYDGSGEVHAEAATDLPMSLMRVFNISSRTLTVGCSANLEMSNSDIMFVLDTTGSMTQANPGDSGNRISALRAAVKSFHATLEKTRAGGNAIIRYGFVPYNNNINVGYLLKREWMVDRWTYQSRVPGANPGGNSYYWNYRPVSYDVSPLKGNLQNGLMKGGTIKAPIAAKYRERAIHWEGCIEERDTVRNSHYANALDLDIDLVPTSSQATRWRPYLPKLIYTRRALPDYSDGYVNREKANFENMGDYEDGRWTVCPSPAVKLTPMTGGEIADYVDTLQLGGWTAHDVGLIWGARLLSPDGLFASENRQAANGGPIARHMIFMTDGVVNTAIAAYDAYGFPPLDKRRSRHRQTGEEQEAMIIERSAEMCRRIKDKGIILWVIAFGTDMTPALQQCASPGRAFEATNNERLNAAFTQIATQIGELRLTL